MVKDKISTLRHGPAKAVVSVHYLCSICAVSGYSGKVGGMVYVQLNGQEVIRTVQVRGKKSWSPRQELHRQRFAAINEYCGKNQYVIKTIWDLAAENGHGYNLFLSANTPAGRRMKISRTTILMTS